MSCAQAHWVGSKPILRVMQLKLHKPTMAIGYSLRMCVRHVDSTNPGRSNLVFRSKPIPEAEMSNRLIPLNITVIFKTVHLRLYHHLFLLHLLFRSFLCNWNFLARPICTHWQYFIAQCLKNRLTLL